MPKHRHPHTTQTYNPTQTYHHRDTPSTNISTPQIHSQTITTTQTYPHSHLPSTNSHPRVCLLTNTHATFTFTHKYSHTESHSDVYTNTYTKMPHTNTSRLKHIATQVHCAGWFYANLTQLEPFGKRDPQLRKHF